MNKRLTDAVIHNNFKQYLKLVKEREMGDSIDVGDNVKIYFSTQRPIVGIVKYKSQANGDSWRVLTSDGNVVYVLQFDYMLKITDAQF